MRKNRCFLLLILALILTGCSGLQKTVPVKRFYGLDVNPGFSSQDIRGTDAAETGKSVLVRELRISPPYDSHAFVYKMGPQSYTTDFYNEFITYPTRLISEKIAEQLYASIYFSPPVSARKQAIDYRVSGKITRLYGDFQVKIDFFDRVKESFTRTITGSSHVKFSIDDFRKLHGEGKRI